jgi:uncharacterized membrane protein SpoIIM required for sporulation
MKLDRFVKERQPAWNELEELVRQARRRPQRLDPARIRRLGELYRGAAADLALARRRFPGDPVAARLEELVGRARHLVYASQTRRGSVVRFFARDYWHLVRSHMVAVGISAALLFAPASLAASWALRDRPAAMGLVPAEFRPAVEEKHPWRDLSAGDQAAFSTLVQANNIKVTAAAFAGGITLGLLTAVALIFNGVLLGAVAGLMIGAGNWLGFVDLVTAHGVLELSCLIVGGAAGLSLGWSIVDPGRGTRGESLVAEGRRSVALVIGTAPWLVVAGIVEGFRATLAEAGLGAVISVGVGLGVLYWGLVFTLGRVTPATDEHAP